jgi:hypothetical protein
MVPYCQCPSQINLVRGGVNVRGRHSSVNGGGDGGRKYVLTIATAVTTLSCNLPVEGARVAVPFEGGQAGAVKGTHSS